jgi:Family of unknown function (DUF6117)
MGGTASIVPPVVIGQIIPINRLAQFLRERGRAYSFQETAVAIPDHACKNFQTLLRAAQAGHLALMECTDAATSEVRYVLCAVGWRDGEHLMTPFGHLADGNPYEMYIPPDSDPEAAAP